ncbi:hypothetical protein F0562_015545 [Nyssa sinensis]|uniref:Uncharacterized protein n=1 Tax=Nyssa sinensis TaxID=561372 RepID=A0A5J4ZLW6_9ASTE|nr:hypothetical protein F0562_015545 [Nyssa sinensis]
MRGAAPDPVLDIAGKKLRTGTGVEYYILPLICGSRGRLTLASSRTRNHSCPLDVVQEKHQVDNGLTLTFSPVNPKKGVVEVSTDFNVKFSGATICVQSTVWKLDLDESTGRGPGGDGVNKWGRDWDELLGRAERAHDAVLDVRGEELQTGVSYNILSVMRPGGGLSVSKNRNNESRCPLDVVQAPLWRDDGLPWTFWPVNNDTVVRVLTDLNIKSSTPTICIQSLVWKLSDYDASVGRFFVTTDGVVGNPGCGTLRNWFRIEKDRDDYKFVFCPSVCDTGRLLCHNVGIFREDGVLRLALSDYPVWVMFRKAAEDFQFIKNVADHNI